MHLVTNYLDQYQQDLRKSFYRRSRKDNFSLFTQHYRDHVREVNLCLHFIASYRLPPTSPLARQWTKKATFHLLLAFEDVKGLDFLVDLHPSRRSLLEREAALHFSHLRMLQEFSTSTYSSPPSRSA